MLTEKEKKSHVTNVGKSCPYSDCGSSDLDYDALVPNDNIITQVVYCGSCNLQEVSFEAPLRQAQRIPNSSRLLTKRSPKALIRDLPSLLYIITEKQ